MNAELAGSLIVEGGLRSTYPLCWLPVVFSGYLQGGTTHYRVRCCSSSKSCACRSDRVLFPSAPRHCHVQRAHAHSGSCVLTRVLVFSPFQLYVVYCACSLKDFVARGQLYQKLSCMRCTGLSILHRAFNVEALCILVCVWGGRATRLRPVRAGRYGGVQVLWCFWTRLSILLFPAQSSCINLGVVFWNQQVFSLSLFSYTEIGTTPVLRGRNRPKEYTLVFIVHDRGVKRFPII